MTKQILLTGAFGNIGTHTYQRLIENDYKVRCFDLPSARNRAKARLIEHVSEVVWGDLRKFEDVQKAVSGVDTILHLGFVIPRLSVTGVNSEDAPDFAYSVNVGGTQNLIEAIQQTYPKAPPRFIFASSLHVFGRTQHLPPPRKVTDPVAPVEQYAKHKVVCEDMLKNSALPWSIFRLPATLPVQLILDEGMYDVPLENRIEYAHGQDVGLAFANAINQPAVEHKTLLIGGGPKCQYIYRQIVERVMGVIGVGMLPESAFSKTPYSTDWLDTNESQALLGYQTRTLDDYLTDLKNLLAWRKPLISILNPWLRKWLLSKSRYYASVQAY